jgi:thiaminase (transcriptional activator TenA)
MTSLSAELWTANADLAHACLASPFVRGIAAANLPVERFRAFVGQDAYFLDAFARAYALALARSPDRDGVEAFARLIAGVLDELTLHAAYAARWQVDLSRTEPAEATLAYTSFLLATASLRGVGETCAAMTPCMRLYAYLGQQLSSSNIESNPYREWITTYAAPEFEALAAQLEDLLNRYAAHNQAEARAYRRAMRLELAFFEAHAPHR